MLTTMMLRFEEIWSKGLIQNAESDLNWVCTLSLGSILYTTMYNREFGIKTERINVKDNRTMSVITVSVDRIYSPNAIVAGDS